MWERRIRSGRRNAHGIASIRRDTYNTVQSGASTKGGWHEMQRRVAARSGNKCEARINGVRCNAPGDDVHHILALSNGGTTTMANLIHLCVGCHARRHRHLFRKGYGKK